MNPWDDQPVSFEDFIASRTPQAAAKPSEQPLVVKTPKGIALLGTKNMANPMRNVATQPIPQTPQPMPTGRPLDLGPLQKYFDSQQGDVDKLREQAEGYENAKPGVDFSPLISYVDSLSGGNMQAAYQKPMTAKDNRDQAVLLRKLARDTEGGLLKDAVSLKNSQGTNDANFQKALLAMTARGLASEKGNDKEAKKALERYQAGLVRETKDLGASLESFGRVDLLANLAQTNPTAAAGVPIALARALGEKGPLSDFDVSQWGGSKAVIDRLGRSYEKLTQGTLDKKDAEWMQEVASKAAAYAEQRLRMKQEDAALRYGENWGGDVEENIRKLTGRERKREEAKPVTAATAPSAPAAKTFTRAQIEDAAKKSGKSVDEIKAQLKAKGHGYQD